MLSLHGSITAREQSHPINPSQCEPTSSSSPPSFFTCATTIVLQAVVKPLGDRSLVLDKTSPTTGFHTFGVVVLTLVGALCDPLSALRLPAFVLELKRFEDYSTCLLGTGLWVVMEFQARPCREHTDKLHKSVKLRGEDD